MMRSNKKGQVTMFVVIGIIVLVVAGIIITMNVITEEPSEDVLITQIAETPVEFQPINDFIESCIAKTGQEGITKLGFHGGYIDLNNYGIRPNVAEPTESRAFYFNSIDKESGIAYWHYFKSNNECEEDCECGTEQPHLGKNDGDPNIERQLQDYVDDNLEDCLLEFIAFENQGFQVKAEDEVETSVVVRDEDVFFYVKYKVEVKKGESEYEIDEYIETVPVQLKKVYELANGIKEAEINSTVTERWAVEQISSFGLGLDQNKLPPIAASELDPGENPVFWMQTQVKDNIQNNMLPQYTPLLSVFGTRNYNYDSIGTIYERATIPVASPSNFDYSDIDVNFRYLNWWPIYLDITGRGVSGERIGPETMSSSFFSFIGIKRYNFYYDVSYPILVDIYDKDAFNGEGFHFYMGLESNVRNNEPLNCSGPGLTQYATPSGSLFCNHNQGCANITLQTIDAETNQPLEDVIIYYSSTTESCDKGRTVINSAGKAELIANMPQCVGEACSINAVKEDYWYYPQTYAVRCGLQGGACLEDNVLCNTEGMQLNMYPYKRPNVTIMKKKMTKVEEKKWAFNSDPIELLDNEYAIISLEKIKDNINEETLAVAGVFRGNESAIQLPPGLVPGNYQLMISLFYDLPDTRNRNVITFAEVEECEDILGGLLGEECYTVGPYNFTDNFIEGGFVANVTLTRDMLSKGNLIFYAVSAPDIDTAYSVLDAYDIEEISKMEYYSNIFKPQLKPTAS